MTHDGPIEKLDELTPVERWKLEIQYSQKELEKFHERAKKVNDRYLDERSARDAGDRKFNLFYANTGILVSSLYAQIPEPDVKRKYLDYKDQLARVGANILQRCITPDNDDPRDMFDMVMKQCVQDRLIPGLGTAWLRLETDTEVVTLDPTPFTEDLTALPAHGFDSTHAVDEPQLQQQAQLEPIEYERITDQRVAIDYVYWRDFFWSPCRVWQERRWVARRVYMTRDELIERFGEELGELIPLTHSPRSANKDLQKHMVFTEAEVYEIWDRTERKVIWLSMDYDEILDEQEDILGLVGFDPCPKPMMANLTTSSTVPRPDYYMFQDQYDELDEVNSRISLLVKACRLAGVYDQSAGGLATLLSGDAENKLVPVDSWAAFAEKGGMQGAIDWLPLGEIDKILSRLQEAREAIKNQIYELTGISDIVRGTSKASETLGAQELKAQFASVRINKLQDEVARFAAEILRIKAEIMVKHFTPELLIEKSNVLRTDDAPAAQMAVQMMQSEAGFEWRIEVTSDQLAQADYAMQKQDRIELLTATGQYISQIRDVAMAVPQMAPLFVQLLKWAVSGFKGARDIEGMLDRELDALVQGQGQGQGQGPGHPDPEQQRQQQEAEADAQAKQVEQQQKQQAFQLDMASKIDDLQHQKASNQLDLIKSVQNLGV